MKYGKALLIAAIAVGAAAATISVLRPDDVSVTPRAWIVDAAIALNRDSIFIDPQGAAHVSDNRRDAALRLANSGRQLRVQRRFAEAEATFWAAVKADPMDADSWADLADCAAAAAGSDLTVSRNEIARALAIDPRHRKALWLRASLELQERQYAAAAATWRELRALVPPGSNDARVIAANIAEADALSRPVAVTVGRGS